MRKLSVPRWDKNVLRFFSLRDYIEFSKPGLNSKIDTFYLIPNE